MFIIRTDACKCAHVILYTGNYYNHKIVYLCAQICANAFVTKEIVIIVSNLNLKGARLIYGTHIRGEFASIWKLTLVLLVFRVFKFKVD